jgi:hypothetical protein
MLANGVKSVCPHSAAFGGNITTIHKTIEFGICSAITYQVSRGKRNSQTIDLIRSSAY